MIPQLRINRNRVVAGIHQCDANCLSVIRYQGGLDSYLQVLDAGRNRFQGELVEAELGATSFCPLSSSIALLLAAGSNGLCPALPVASGGNR